jgi:crotonobetainyl-CoA:carnitine CoA-transferase CaiB-like acyl-CoA transferase
MPHSAHPSIVPFQAFATADGWMTVACAKQKFWERLCGVLGREDLADDPRFAGFADRDRHRDELLPILQAAFAERSTDGWIDALADAGVPCGPVHDVAEALADPQAQARGDVVEIGHPRFGTVRQVASPLRVAAEQEAAPLERAPERGEHTDAVLREVCGYAPERVAELRRRGAFG